MRDERERRSPGRNRRAMADFVADVDDSPLQAARQYPEPTIPRGTLERLERALAELPEAASGARAGGEGAQ